MEKKKRCSTNEFLFLLKKDKDITAEEKEQMHDLLIKMYPSFTKYYEKNRYYSTIKPQMNFLIKRKKSNELVGTGKFLWKNIKLKNEKIRLFAFGLIIDKKFQNIGLGTKLIKIGLKKARKMDADIYYGSTSNPILEKLLIRLGFKKVATTIKFKDSITRKINKIKDNVYVFEFKRGLINKINSLKELYIGVGSI